MNRLLTVCGALLGLLLASTTAWAHKVNIFAYLDGKTVYTESYFADGKAVENGRISVRDKSGAILVEGKTGADGLYSFSLPREEELTIVLDASMGHKSSFVLPVTPQK